MEFNKLKMDKEQFEKGWNVTKRISKAIVIKGTQALILETATKVLKTSFDGGVDDVKKLGLDDIIGKEKPEGPKKKWFSRKKDEVEEILDDVENTLNDENYDDHETYEQYEKHENVTIDVDVDETK